MAPGVDILGMPSKEKKMSIWRRLGHLIGPGVITGASDDDPSGITTYSIAGANAGYKTLWTALFTFPLMVAVQEMCARIGLVTGHGLAGAFRKYFPQKLLYLLFVLMFLANTVNIGADLLGMSAAVNLLVPIPVWVIAIILAALIIVLMIKFPYIKIARYLKWLAFSLFAYIAAALIVSQDWLAIVKNTFIPRIEWNSDFLMLIVAIFGTTISPYLFFWQTSEEVEERGLAKKKIVTKHELLEMRGDVTLGMLLSNLVTFFIIALTGSVFFRSGVKIETIKDAAEALRPLAGNASYLLFTLGVLGTGLLAIPVLAGSAAYIFAEVFKTPEGLSQPFRKARAFYGVIIISVVLGLVMSFVGVSPVKALFYTAVLYGLLSPPLILIVMLIANNKKIMGRFKNRWFSNIFGGATFLVMTAAVLGMIFI